MWFQRLLIAGTELISQPAIPRASQAQSSSAGCVLLLEQLAAQWQPWHSQVCSVIAGLTHRLCSPALWLSAAVGCHASPRLEGWGGTGVEGAGKGREANIC